ncbi:hypothetical protein ALQ37_04983 [Pseudomonas syringae pv. aptata]|uniref:Uncharacterized protein n=1 Tax=Pseudomonas syringae pv. aptata TaxID=83167 RepID=A0A3M3XEM1_PSEAP|nr:hypothetical protein ALQ37_04983 [Pseudomonas syringae pv. aptata]
MVLEAVTRRLAHQPVAAETFISEGFMQAALGLQAG